MSAAVRWTKGGEGAITAIDGDRVTAHSTVPSAPGSRLDGALNEGGGSLRIKVARCRRQGEAFTIDGRLIDTTREVRAAIERSMANGETGGPGGP
jgi:hypothetical protein